MTARDDLRLELYAVLRARKQAKAKLEDIVEQRADLMVNPKVQRYVELHTTEQVARDHLGMVEQRVLELVDMLEEAP